MLLPQLLWKWEGWASAADLEGNSAAIKAQQGATAVVLPQHLSRAKRAVLRLAADSTGS